MEELYRPVGDALKSELATRSGARLAEFLSPRLIREISSRCAIESDLLFRRTLLHLPKFSDQELSESNRIEKEITRVAYHVERRTTILPRLVSDVNAKLEVGDLEFDDLSEELAREINESYHYIGYHRKEGLYKGLFGVRGTTRVPVSVITLSEFDLTHLIPYLPPGVRPNEILVVSRVYSFEWAPRNSLSFLLSSTVKWLRRERPSTRMLLTYVNPNVGFSGASYKAANWLFFGREIDTKYAYLNEDYITMRAISEKVIKNEVLEDHLRYSVQPLEPLEVYAYFVDKALRSKYPSSFNHEVKKNPPIV